MADMFPSAEIIGTDLSPTEPQWLPVNCKFEIDEEFLHQLQIDTLERFDIFTILYHPAAACFSKFFSWLACCRSISSPIPDY